MKNIFIILILGLFFTFEANAENEYETPNYSLISTQVLEEVCSTKFGCSNTIKKEILSSDGFMFETFLTDKTDSVWCYNHFSKPNFPCSTIGDTGAGKNEMVIHNTNNKQKVRIINNSPIDSGRISRIETPLEFKFIVMEILTGGMACCVSYEFYFKEDLSLKPFVIENSTSTLSITKENKAILYLNETIYDHFRYQ